MPYVLSRGDVGTDVRRLQLFLNDTAGAELSPDGDFGSMTRNALIMWQKSKGLNQSGVVDEITWDTLASLGLVLCGAPAATAQTGSGWPPRPQALVQPTAAATAAAFGQFRFRHAPTADNPERIEILDGWEAQNIVSLPIPELDGCLVAGGASHVVAAVGRVRCHRLAAPRFVALFKAWAAAGLMDRVLTFEGVFNARLKRGATSATQGNLSNHSWGTAIDLNARQNPLGAVPVGLGARGCLRELVEIANANGFYWGGHFRTRPDGMHFELSP